MRPLGKINFKKYRALCISEQKVLSILLEYNQNNVLLSFMNVHNFKKLITFFPLITRFNNIQWT